MRCRVDWFAMATKPGKEGQFSVGDHVRIAQSHRLEKYRGLIGRIDRKIPVNKAYIVLGDGLSEVIVDINDLEFVQ